MFTCQMFLTTHCSLQAVTWKMAPTVENGEQNVNSKDTGGREEPLIAQINHQPGSLTDLLQNRYRFEYKPYNTT